MSALSFEVPEGASVQIIVGKTPVLALADETAHEPPRRGRFVRTAAKGLAVLALLAGGYMVGQHSTGGTNRAGETTTAQAAIPTPPPVRQAFPDSALASDQPAVPPAPAPAQVPPAFTQELRQPPTVVPPPGQPPASSVPAKNPFGLEP